MLLILLIGGFASAFAQGIPEKPNPQKLVNDYIGLLSPEQQAFLENKLDRFNDFKL